MKVGSMHFLCCCNCGGHHKANKCMERKDAQTADDPADRGAESVRCWAGRGPHFKRDRNKNNVSKKVKYCISESPMEREH